MQNRGVLLYTAQSLDQLVAAQWNRSLILDEAKLRGAQCVERRAFFKDVCEFDGRFSLVWHRGRWLLYGLREAGAPAHQALAEIVGLLALLHVHLQLDDTVWVKILCLLERCVRAGMPVNAQTLRPLCIAAVSIAVKENYDEGMSANDVRRALPHLTLWHLGFIELDLLQLIGWRATIWEASEWTAYVAGLRTLLTETAADLRDFAQRYGEVINTIVETPLISPRPPPAASE